MKKLLKDKKRVLIIVIAVAVVLSATAYGMSIPNFTDYNPPSTLIIRWGDFFTNASLSQHQLTQNTDTGFRYWTADFPYRAMFFGGKPVSSAEQKHDSYLYIVYSKVPTTDIFTFEYIAGDKNIGNRTGYIRALYDKTYDTNDFKVTVCNWSGVQASSVDINGFNQVTYQYGSHTVGNKAYFEFDFFYKCAGDHQQNVYDLNINGAKSVSGVPYSYILSCAGHSGGATSEIGSSSSGDGSSSGGSSSGVGSGNSNTNGDGGRHGWGSGEYGGGVDKNGISKPDMELSVPDDWKKPVEDNYNSMPSEYKPDYPEYVPAEGDTGQDGSDWELPSFSGDDGVTGEVNGYKEFIPNGEQGYLEFLPPDSEWGYIEFNAGGETGLIDFMNP